jgi:cbb3-type cytochrome oxidase subunit 3
MPAAVVLLFFSIFFVCVLKIITIINKQNKTKNEEKEGVWRRCSHVLHPSSFLFFFIFFIFFNNNNNNNNKKGKNGRKYDNNED